MKTIELKWIEDVNHNVAEDAYNGLKELIATGVFPNIEVECKDDTLYITGEKEILDKVVMKIQKAYVKYGQIMIKEAHHGVEQKLRIESFDDNVQDIFNHTLNDYETFKENCKVEKPTNYITALGKFQFKFNKLKEAANRKDKKIIQNYLNEIEELSENYEEPRLKPIKESIEHDLYNEEIKKQLSNPDNWGIVEDKLDEGKLIDAAALMVYSQLVDMGYKHSAQQMILNNIDYINEHSNDNPSELTDNIIKRWKRQEKRKNKEYEKLNNESYEEINEDSLDDMIDNTGHDPERIATKGFSGYIPDRYTDCCFTFITKNWRDMEKYGLPSHPVFFPRDTEDIDNQWMTHTYLNFKQTLKLFDKVPDKILKVTPRQRNGWSFGNVDGDYVSKDAWIAFAKKFLGIEPPSPKPRKPRDPNKGYKKPDYVNPDMNGGTYFDGDTQVYEMPEENESFNEDYNYYKNPFRQMAEKRKRKISKDTFNKKFSELVQTYANAEDLDLEAAYDLIAGNDEIYEYIDSNMTIEDIMDKISAGEIVLENKKIDESFVLSPSELKKKLQRVASKWASEKGVKFEDAYNELRKKKSVKDMLDFYSVDEIIDDLKKQKKEVDDELEDAI